MGLLRITNGLESFSDAKLLEKCNFIHRQMTTRSSVFPTPSPTMAVLGDACEEFQLALNKALGGDRMLVAQKNNQRQALIELMHKLSYYVLFAASGDRLVAMESGFSVIKEPTPVIITKPTHLKVINSDQQGELLVSIKRVKGARAYLHQYSTDPLLKEESWMSMRGSTTKCKISGLKPGTLYYLRVVVIGSKDQVMFSDVVSRIAA